MAEVNDVRQKSEIKDCIINKDSCLVSYFILQYILREWNTVEPLRELKKNLLTTMIERKELSA